VNRAPLIIINAIFDPLRVACRYGGHTRSGLRKSIPDRQRAEALVKAGAKHNARDQALLDLAATARSRS